MTKDQEVTLSLFLVLILVVVLALGGARFFSVILTDILTYHPTQLKLTPELPKLTLPNIEVNVPNPFSGNNGGSTGGAGF